LMPTKITAHATPTGRMRRPRVENMLLLNEAIVLVG
jgi:hypothetical protein